jgi:hypothetical protein
MYIEICTSKFESDVLSRLVPNKPRGILTRQRARIGLRD